MKQAQVEDKQVTQHSHAAHHAASETDEITGLQQRFAALEKHIDETSEVLGNYLGTRPAEEIAKRIHALKLTDKSLHLLRAGIVMDKDDVRVLMLMGDVEKNSGADAKEDVTDHINYTAL